MFGQSIYNQASAITGSAINVNLRNQQRTPPAEDDEPSTFMEYDVSSVSGYNRTNELRNTRGEMLQDEDIAALKEMLDYATDRIEFSEQTRRDATREKNVICGEISKTELKCMSEVEDLSRMFFRHIQDMHSQIMQQNDASSSANENSAKELEDDVRTKRLNEMKLRGRIAMRQLKQELKQAWSHNRDMMSKIVMLSHSSMAAMPLQDRSIRVDNQYEGASEDQRTDCNISSTEDTSKATNQNSASQLSTNQVSEPANPPQKSPKGIPESTAPGHVLEFLRKFISSKDISVLEKEQVKILFKALDEAYSDQQKLRQTIEDLSAQSSADLETSRGEKAAKVDDQLQDYKNKVSRLRNKLATITDENSQLRAKNEHLQQVVQKVNNVMESTREKVIERDQFEQKCHNLEQKLRRVETQMSENEKSFNRTLVNLKRELKEALDGKKQFEREINSLLVQSQNNADAKNLMGRLQQLERERMEAETRAEALAENLKFLTTRMESQETQIYQGKVTIENLRKEIENLHKQKTQFENTPQYQNMAAQMQMLEKKLQNAENRISEIVCERDQFKFLYELSLQKLRAQDEKPKHVSKAEKKLMKQNSDSSNNASGEQSPKKNSALNLLEKKFLNKGSSSKNNSSQNVSSQSLSQTQSQPVVTHTNQAYAPSSASGVDSDKTSLNSSATVASSTGALNSGAHTQSGVASKLHHRPKIISPRIAKSPVPPPLTHPQSAESVTPLSPGKLKGKWQAL